MDKVSVVILNWNGLKFLKEYLPALVENTPQSLHGKVSIVVADNNSSDGSMEYLLTSWPQVRTISLDRNYGFTGGTTGPWHRWMQNTSSFSIQISLFPTTGFSLS